jgi:S1-C subfamily serine protease
MLFRASSYKVSGMNSLLRSLTLVSVSTALSSNWLSGQALRSTAAIASSATPATVTILALNAAGDTLGQGSGFFVQPMGLIVTNWHVMSGASQAIVIRANGETFKRVTFVDGDSAADVAVIKVPGYGLPVLESRADVPPVGARVIAIGSPLGLQRSVTEGIVSATRMVAGRELVQISAAISPGSSGGAVLDGSGRVFAVSTSQLSAGQQLNFAVPVRYALGLIGPTIVEKSLSDIFANASPRQGGPNVGRPLSDLPPAASAIIRASMDGIWYGTEKAMGPKRPQTATARCEWAKCSLLRAAKGS